MKQAMTISFKTFKIKTECTQTENKKFSDCKHNALRTENDFILFCIEIHDLWILLGALPFL